MSANPFDKPPGKRRFTAEADPEPVVASGHVHGTGYFAQHGHEEHHGHDHHGHDHHDHHHAPKRPPMKMGTKLAWLGGATVAGGLGAYMLEQWGKAATPVNEREKTAEQRAEDIAYTINHAVSCATTDMLIAPTIAAAVGVNIGCLGHDHGPGEHHDHHHGKPKFSWSLYGREALHYLKGEVIGDLAAVPLTIGVQRAFPHFMAGMRKLVEPVAAPVFRFGADQGAKQWAAREHITDAQAIADHAQATYEHEMSHLPQAVVWNMFAFPIGVAGQKWGGHAHSVGEIVRNKALGAVVSNGILLGGRALMPELAEKIDAANSRTIIAPISQAVTRTLGLPDAKPEGWTERVGAEESSEIKR